MLASLFGPDGAFSFTAERLFALPLDWMTIACMAPRFRRATGWLGLSPCPGGLRAWTCRVESRPGVFGLAPEHVEIGEDLAEVRFAVFYFPSPDDPVLERMALPAAILAARPDTLSRCRDFPNHPDLLAAFPVAEMRLAATRDLNGAGLFLGGEWRRRIAAPEGIVHPESGDWLVAPGEWEEDLPAFDIARDVFAVLAAGFSTACRRAPDAIHTAWAPSATWLRRPDGALDPAPARDGAFCHADILLWGDEAPLAPAFPELGQPARPEDDAYALCRHLPRPGDESDDHAPSDSDLPRLVVLSGFLGSGKTTFLNQFIEYHASHDRLVTVIQNELGETGVDSLLLEGDESVLAIDAGCVCCSLSGSLGPALRLLNERFHPEIVVLETTGLANPLNMRDELRELDRLAELEAVVTVVDAERYFDTLAESEVAAGQIAAADAVVLNKCDLADEARRATIAADIQDRNPRARIFETTHGRVNPALLSQGLLSHRRDAGDPPHAHRHCHAHHHPHGHPHHGDDGFAALRLDLAERVDPWTLRRALDACPPGVRRIKGVVHLAGDDRPKILQYVPGRFECVPASKPITGKPFLLVIGRDLDPGPIGRHFAPLAQGSRPCI